MKVGLFFGSFNPIHIGHLIIANTMVEQPDIDQVWFVISPQNPFKSSKSLLHEFDRMDMVELAIEDNFNLRASDVEFNMPRPSYTIDTLTYLSSKHPQHDFRLIIGEDNLKSFSKWKNYKQILTFYGLEVYPRPNLVVRAEIDQQMTSPPHNKRSRETEADVSKQNKIEIIKNHPNVRMVEAPLLDISATFIRSSIRRGLSIKYIVHDKVESFIKDRKLYL